MSVFDIPETTGAMNAAFVADARRSYVPAIRWLRANGWNWRNGDFRNQEQRLSIEWNEGSPVRGGTPYITINTRTEYGSLLRCPLMADVASAAQAVDLLVTAGILPVPMHSLMQVDAETAAYKATMPEVYGGPSQLATALASAFTAADLRHLADTIDLPGTEGESPAWDRLLAALVEAQKVS